MTGPVMIGADDMAGADRMVRVVDTLAEAFADLSAGRTGSPPRTIIEHGPARQLLVGPAVWERRGVASVKITTLTPDNPARGLPLIHGVVVLTDLTTGRITALLDGAELTAIRTGAVAALATRRCAPPDAGTLAIIGAGVQAHALAHAISAVRPIHTIRLHSRTSARAATLADRLHATLGHQVTVYDSAQAAVTDAEIICTATSTPDPTPLLLADWITPGAHLNIIGGTNENAIEVDPTLLPTALVVVEDRTAALEDAGEIRAALAAALISQDALHELGSLVTDTAATTGRTTVFRSVGLPIEDTATAAALHECR